MWDKDKGQGECNYLFYLVGEEIKRKTITKVLETAETMEIQWQIVTIPTRKIMAKLKGEIDLL